MNINIPPPDIALMLSDPDRLKLINDLQLNQPIDEPSFDRLTHLTSRCLRVPVAFVNVVDDHQHVSKSCCIPSDSHIPRVFRLEESLCKYVIALKEPLIIPDTRLHPLTINHALIIRLHVLAYASAPLITPDGLVLGSLCVMDIEPRQWTNVEIANLVDLAYAVSTEIQLRQDIQRRQQLEWELREQYTLTSILQQTASAANEAVSVDQAFQSTIDVICKSLSWPVGHAYKAHAAGEIESTGIWHLSDPESAQGTCKTTVDGSYDPQRGLPGFVYQTGVPYWSSNPQHDLRVARKSVFAKDGIKSVMLFPVLIESEVVGILEFFAFKPEPERADVLQVMGVVGTQLGRVVERERYKQSLLQQALLDPVTGLANRWGFLLNAEKALQFAYREQTSAALFFIDLDHMKHINDTWGHAVGDQALQMTAAVMRQTFRASDCLARIGGDEFVVFAQDYRPDQHTALLDRIAAITEDLTDELHVPFDLQMSIGVVLVYPDQPRSIEELLAEADSAMYEHKRERKRN